MPGLSIDKAHVFVSWVVLDDVHKGASISEHRGDGWMKSKVRVPPDGAECTNSIPDWDVEKYVDRMNRLCLAFGATISKVWYDRGVLRFEITGAGELIRNVTFLIGWSDIERVWPEISEQDKYPPWQPFSKEIEEFRLLHCLCWPWLL